MLLKKHLMILKILILPLIYLMPKERFEKVTNLLGNEITNIRDITDQTNLLALAGDHGREASNT